MGIVVGLIKYFIKTPLTVVGAISMYIFGGVVITLFNTWTYLFQGEFISAFLEYFVNSALPPTSIGHVLFQILVGISVAGAKWFFAMGIRGIPL